MLREPGAPAPCTPRQRTLSSPGTLQCTLEEEAQLIEADMGEEDSQSGPFRAGRLLLEDVSLPASETSVELLAIEYVAEKDAGVVVARGEAAHKAVSVEAALEEDGRRNAACVEDARQDAVREEAARIEAARIEAASVKAACVEAAHVEAAYVEAAHVEAAHVKAAHVEAAHAEAPHVEAPHVEAPHGAITQDMYHLSRGDT